MSHDWIFPGTTHREDGESRQVGIEIELQGIEIEKLAQLTAETLGGDLKRESDVEYMIDVPEQGSFRVEVDFRLLKELAKEQEQGDANDSELMTFAVKLLGGASSVLVPCEIVTPPLKMDAIADPMDRLVQDLRAAGGRGTRQSMFYAFGVHLNVEPPSLDAATVSRFLRAFVCLYDWIVDEGQVDLARQLSPYIKPYKKEYDLLIANPEYAPDWDTLIDDYLAHNPTRDRALDMLPMFAEIDEKRVRATVDDPLIQARPAFHYRLANSCIDEDGWSVAHPWNRWVMLERLASDEKLLRDVATAFLEDRPRLMRQIDKQWVSKLRGMLQGLEA